MGELHTALIPMQSVTVETLLTNFGVADGTGAIPEACRTAAAYLPPHVCTAACQKVNPGLLPGSPPLPANTHFCGVLVSC